MPITIEEFNEFKKSTNEALNHLSAGMTRVQNAHDKTLKELFEVKKELQNLKEPKTSITLKTSIQEKG